MTQTTALATTDINLDDLQRTARMLAASGYFDAKGSPEVQIAQLATKIMAGRELGYGPFASVQGIHVIQGKPQVSAIEPADVANLDHEGDCGNQPDAAQGLKAVYRRRQRPPDRRQGFSSPKPLSGCGHCPFRWRRCCTRCAPTMRSASRRWIARFWPQKIWRCASTFARCTRTTVRR